MKNQNDMIISIVAIVVALIALGVLYGTKPDPKAAKAPQTVKTAAPTLGDVKVPVVNGIGSGSATNRTAGGFSAPAGGGARPGFTGAGSANGAPPAAGGGGMTVGVSSSTNIP